MTVVAVVSTVNVDGKKDASGAFVPEARAFLRFHGADPKGDAVVPFDHRLSPDKRRAHVEAGIRAAREALGAPIEGLAFFCHGYRRGLQTGHTTKALGGLVDVIRETCSHDVAIPLYACDAARDADADRKDDLTDVPGGDGGFADVLRDAMLRTPGAFFGAHIDAHVTAAHTTRNPHVRRFEVTAAVPSETILGLPGGSWLVTPGSSRWKTWIRALRTDFRFRFPFLDAAGIAQVLDRGTFLP
ncbi:MAG: hypothetical protein H6721_26735 [Sandaracinus sp.]|nr:hypothetical protein [Sandaracinus sp.]MCB9616105.1 hypothetical protein [Sandaracinus sp.]MCB9620447.1 hypothetical protein [Sandaracinus sp.]MCB9624698.1 hypothetical protein [Sandaracinus sp.]MCB9635731.1 hypothetical protein [Sandaracinus sp.]